MKLNIEYEYDGERNTPINIAAALIKMYEPDTYEKNEIQDRIDDLDEIIEHLQVFTHRGTRASWEPF